jgi:lipopolysaccharide export system protein LptA
MRIAADRVEVLYSETETPRTVEKVIATGGVLITRGEDAAEGDWALYEISNSLLTMEGDVVVTQAGTTIAGDRMVMDMVTGNSTVDGRVRTVLIPDQQP